MVTRSVSKDLQAASSLTRRVSIPYGRSCMKQRLLESCRKFDGEDGKYKGSGKRT